MCNFFNKKETIINSAFTFQRDGKNFTSVLSVREGKFLLSEEKAVEGETENIFPTLPEALTAVCNAQALTDTEKVKAAKASAMKKATTPSERVEKMREAYNQKAVAYILTENEGVYTVSKEDRQARVTIIPKAATEKRPAIDYGFNLSTFELLRIADNIAYGDYNDTEAREKIREALTEYYATNNLTEAQLFNFKRVKALTYAARVRIRATSHINTLKVYNPYELIAYLTFCDEPVYKKFIEEVEKLEKKNQR